MARYTRLLCLLCVMVIAIAFMPISISAKNSVQQVVIASTFPVWLFARNIVDGTGIDIELLIPSRQGCPHNFSPSPIMMKALDVASVIIVNGAGLESSLSEYFNKIDKSKITFIDCAKGIAPLGFGPDTDAGHDPVNSHIFASPSLAAKMVDNLARSMAKVFPDKAEVIMANRAKYAGELAELAGQLEIIGKSSTNRKIAVQHEALIYLLHDTALEISVLIPDVLPGSVNAAKLGVIITSLIKTGTCVIAGDSQFNDGIIALLSKEANIPFIKLDPVASGPADAHLDYYQQKMKENIRLLEKYFDAAQDR